MAIKILIGGSPCTYWSIAKNNGRETQAEGMGWELFKNYLIAKEKFKPDYFLYENNKSAAQAIKDQIAEEFGVGVDPNVRFTYINSALVSAQNRQRFYVTNFGDIEQPKDRGILLKDILETGKTDREKSHAVISSAGRTTTREYFDKNQGTMVTEQIDPKYLLKNIKTSEEKSVTLTSSSYKGIGNDGTTTLVEPVFIGEVPEHNGTYRNGKQASQQYRVYDTNSKGVAVTTCAITNVAEKVGNTNMEHLMRPYGSKAKIVGIDEEKAPTLLAAMGTGGGNGIYHAEPVEMIPPCGQRGQDKARTITSGYANASQRDFRMDIETDGFMGKQGVIEAVNITSDGKSHTIKAQYYKNGTANFITNDGFDATSVAEQVKVGALPRPNGELSRSQAMQVYSVDGKSTTQMAGGGGLGGKTGLYAVPLDENVGYATPCEWDENGVPTKAISCADGKTYTVYKVVNGLISIKGKDYPIKLKDGYYIIRKLTVTECARLQTMPDNYCKAVSDSQGYKGLGNGWTAEVIIHLLNHALKDVPRDEEIVVLSMYDGIGTGRYCLDKMGFTNVTYHAYEIDKYPIMVAMDNYPDIIQHGDAFAVREDDWKAPQTRAEWLDDLLAC